MLAASPASHSSRVKSWAPHAPERVAQTNLGRDTHRQLSSLNLSLKSDACESMGEPQLSGAHPLLLRIQIMALCKDTSLCRVIAA